MSTPSFADMVADLEKRAEDGPPEFRSDAISALLTALRAQQAALLGCAVVFNAQADVCIGNTKAQQEWLALEKEARVVLAQYPLPEERK